jgi:hypothetical protein
VSHLPTFEISPGAATAPTAVTLSMSPGYAGTASITSVCGKPLPGASVTVRGTVATPHLPAGYHGTFFVDWNIARAGHHRGLGITMTLASRQQQGHATTCPAARTAAQAVQQPRDGSLTVLPGHSSFPVADAVGGGALLVALALAAIGVARRRRRQRQGARQS